MGWTEIFTRSRRRSREEELPRLGEGGPPAGLISPMSNKRELESHPLIGADANVVDQAMRAAFAGRPQRLQDLFDDMLDRDPRVSSVCATRTLAMQSRPWSVMPRDRDAADQGAKDIAAAITKILSRVRGSEGGGWSSIVGQLADGITRGYSVNEVEWGVTPEGWHAPVRLHWRHPRRFGFSEQLELVRMDIGDPHDGVSLDTWGPDKFVVHAPIAGRMGYPMRRGVLLGMVFPALFKRYGMREWIKATERWGQPIAVAKLPQNQEHLRDEALAMMRRLHSDFVGVLWGGIEIDTVASSGALNPAIYTELVENCNREIAIRGLGQNLTTDVQGGSFAGATVSNLVRQDILSGDLAELDSTITSQLIEPIVRYNWPGAEVPEYYTELAQQEAITLDDVRDGIFSENDYRRSRGYEAKPDGGDEYRTPAVQVPAALTPAPATPSTPAPIAAPQKPKAEENIQAAALNGAQVASMKDIIADVAMGLLPRDTGIEMIAAAFPISVEQATKIMGTVGAGFVPASSGGAPVAEAAEQPPGGAGADGPLASRMSRPTSSRSTSRSTSPTSGAYRVRTNRVPFEASGDHD
jgi:phage gp29-like protein